MAQELDSQLLLLDAAAASQLQVHLGLLLDFEVLLQQQQQQQRWWQQQQQQQQEDQATSDAHQLVTEHQQQLLQNSHYLSALRYVIAVCATIVREGMAEGGSGQDQENCSTAAANQILRAACKMDALICYNLPVAICHLPSTGSLA
jgi:uncharacterized membrane protein YeiB